MWNISQNGDIINKAINSANANQKSRIEEEIRLIWHEVELHSASENWNLTRKVEELNNKLKEKDENALAVLRDTEDAIDIRYKKHILIIHLTPKNPVIEIDEPLVTYTGEHEFSGDNFLNTNVCLYSEENIDKNFEISFDIVSIGSENTNHSTILSSMDESGSPWPGHNVKVYIVDGEQVLKIESNSNISSTGDVVIPSAVTNVRIIRINRILYYSFDGQKCVKLNDYNGFEDYFDVPLTFGGALDGSNNPIRLFDGKLANMHLKFLADDATIDDYDPNRKPLSTVYAHKDPIIFDGTNNINTGIKLFTQDSVDTDFEISFTINNIGTGYESQATILNAKLESKPYPGFAYRLTTDGCLEYTAKGGTDVNKVRTKIATVKTVVISRRDKKMYACINDGQEIEVHDFTDFTGYHDIPLVIGSSMKADGKTGFRYFIGTLSNIFVKLESN